MKKIISPYLTFASRSATLAITGASMLLLAFVVFPSIPIIGKALIDLLPRYSYAEVMALMESYGEDGRALYAWLSPSLDTIFPLIYVTFWAGLIYRLRQKPWVLALLPVLLGVVDLCENAQITTMLITYPDVSQGLVSSASLFTSAKHLLTKFTLLLALVLAVWRLIQWLMTRRAGSSPAA